MILFVGSNKNLSPRVGDLNEKNFAFVLTVIAVYCASAQACFVGGTVDFEKYVRPIIMERPFLRNPLSTLSI